MIHRWSEDNRAPDVDRSEAGVPGLTTLSPCGDGAFFGGVGGGTSVSSGVPPAQTTGGLSAFPGTGTGQVPGSAVSAMKDAATIATRRERIRWPMSATPSDGGPEGDRDHDAVSSGLGAMGRSPSCVRKDSTFGPPGPGRRGRPGPLGLCGPEPRTWDSGVPLAAGEPGAVEVLENGDRVLARGGEDFLEPGERELRVP